MKQIRIRVNGSEHTLTVDPDTPLLFVLSDVLGLRGPKFGCGLGQCGACTVILRGQALRSCVMPVRAVGENDITTLEGLGSPEKPHPIQQAFIDEGAAQCGFCLSGAILTAKAALDANPKASDQDIRDALGGPLCRCFAHVRCPHAARDPEIYAGAEDVTPSRREFVTAGGALVFSFSNAPFPVSPAEAQNAFATHPSHIDSTKLASWLAIGADGAVTAYTGKCDFGALESGSHVAGAGRFLHTDAATAFT